MAILIFGSEGMLGKYICRYCSYRQIPYIGISRKEIDVMKLSFKIISNILSFLKFNYVINCIAVRNETLENMYLINSLFSINLSSYCLEKNIRMIHISTNSVFSKKNNSRHELDIPIPINNYSISKLKGEPSNCIRTSIIGEDDNSKYLLETIKNSKVFHGYSKVFWNGVTCLELTEVILNTIINGVLWDGPRHIIGNTVSKYKLAKLIKEVYKCNTEIIKEETTIEDQTLQTIYPRSIKSIFIQLQELRNFGKLFLNEPCFIY